MSSPDAPLHQPEEAGRTNRLRVNGHEPGVSWRDYVDVRLAAAERAVQLTAEDADRLRDDVAELKLQAAANRGAISTLRFLVSFLGVSGLITILVAVRNMTP